MLRIDELSVHFDTADGIVTAVEDVSLAVAPGEKLCIVGESGSGKSQLFLAIAGLLTANGRLTGSAVFRGQQLVGMSPRELNRIRGDRLSFVFQDPMTALTPHLTVGTQLMEVLSRTEQTGRREARSRAVEMLQRVRIPDAARRLDDYPHQLSGGMRQRVMIAMALLSAPDLLVADEPTTALDVTIQADIVDLLRAIDLHAPIAIVLITHDMGLVAEMADRLVVMYAGRIVEEGPADRLLDDPWHPYTRGLLASVPDLTRPTGTLLHGIEGQPPDPKVDRAGCLFAPRCTSRTDRCSSERPLLATEGDRRLACHLGPQRGRL